MPLTPYDRAVAKANQRQERSLEAEYGRHRQRLAEIDALQQKTLIGARFLAGSPCDDQEINQTRIHVYLSRLGKSQDTTWGEFCASGELSEDDLAQVRLRLGQGKVAVVAYKAERGFLRVWVAQRTQRR